MNDDYLWDRTGEPDAEIQQLEEILGALRYQPRPLEIPRQLHPGSSGLYSPRYAIAASIAIIALGLGLWIGMQRLTGTQKAAANPIDEQKVRGLLAGRVSPEPQAIEKPSVTEVHSVVAKHNSARPVRASRVNASELAEGKAAKDELMFALRLTSAKLSLVQKKMQGTNSGNTIQNQHKIG